MKIKHQNLGAAVKAMLRRHLLAFKFILKQRKT